MLVSVSKHQNVYKKLYKVSACHFIGPQEEIWKILKVCDSGW